MTSNTDLSKHLHSVWGSTFNPKNIFVFWDDLPDDEKLAWDRLAKDVKNMIHTTVEAAKEGEYISVLKNHIETISKKLEQYEEIDAQNAKIIEAYRKMTGIAISIDNDDEREDNGFS